MASIWNNIIHFHIRISANKLLGDIWLHRKPTVFSVCMLPPQNSLSDSGLIHICLIHCKQYMVHTVSHRHYHHSFLYHYCCQRQQSYFPELRSRPMFQNRREGSVECICGTGWNLDKSAL